MLPVFDGLRNITLASVAFRLILSTLCGGIVGMEREFKRRSAGFRTHILICLGAAMTTLTPTRASTRSRSSATAWSSTSSSSRTSSTF